MTDSITTRSRRAVERELDRLRGEYGEFRRGTQTWTLSAADYDRAVERLERGSVGAGCLWVRNDAGEVLLVEQLPAREWCAPGGKQEPGESLEEAARRELAEETGIDAEITGLHFAKVAEQRSEAGDRPPVVALVAMFAGEYRGGEPTPQESEVAAAEWWAEHPEPLLFEDVADLPIPAAEE